MIRDTCTLVPAAGMCVSEGSDDRVQGLPRNECLPGRGEQKAFNFLRTDPSRGHPFGGGSIHHDGGELYHSRMTLRHKRTLRFVQFL
jgi:hypothetical protein